MSKSVKRIIGVVAAIAIPFAAPAISSAIGLSAAVGATAGSALTGAALGAASGAVTGQDIGRSALFGAIGGGIGGYTAGAGGAGGLEEVAVTGKRVAGAMTPADIAAGRVLNQANMAGAGGFFSPGGGAAAFNTAAAAPGAAAPAAAAPSIGTRLGNAIRGVPEQIATKFSDPKMLADLTLRAAGQLAGSALAGSGLSPEEQALLNAQAADLQELKSTNEELFRLRMDQAKALLGEAARDYGFEEEARAAVRGAGLTTEALRGLTGERRRAEQARQLRARSEERGTARARGELLGSERRTATRLAGLQAIPAPPQISTMNARTNLMNMYGTGETRRQEQAGQIGDWFGSLTGQRQGQSIGGGETVEERLRRLEEARQA